MDEKNPGPNKLTDDHLTLNYLDIFEASKVQTKKSRITAEFYSIQLIKLTDNCHNSVVFLAAKKKYVT